jgi:hypothetical protein
MSVRALSIARPHTVLSGVCECCENRRREGRTFLMGADEITFTRVRLRPHDILRVRNVWYSACAAPRMCHVLSCFVTMITFVCYTRAGQLQPTRGPHNSLRTRLIRAALVYTYVYIKPGWGG